MILILTLQTWCPNSGRKHQPQNSSIFKLFLPRVTTDLLSPNKVSIVWFLFLVEDSIWKFSSLHWNFNRPIIQKCTSNNDFSRFSDSILSVTIRLNSSINVWMGSFVFFKGSSKLKITKVVQIPDSPNIPKEARAINWSRYSSSYFFVNKGFKSSINVANVSAFQKIFRVNIYPILSMRSNSDSQEKPKYILLWSFFLSKLVFLHNYWLTWCPYSDYQCKPLSSSWSIRLRNHCICFVQWNPHGLELADLELAVLRYLNFQKHTSSPLFVSFFQQVVNQ